MARSFTLTSTAEDFTVARNDGASVRIGRAADGESMTPLELFVASVVACSASTVSGMIREQYDLPVNPEMRYRYTQAMGATHEVQRIMVEVDGIPGHAEIDIAGLAHEAEETRCTVSLTIKKPPTVQFTQSAG